MQIAVALTLQKPPARPLVRGLEYPRQACHRPAIEVQVGCNRTRQALGSSQTSIKMTLRVCLLSMEENCSLAHISTSYVSRMRRQSSKEGPSL